jgi:hypothetical protein
MIEPQKHFLPSQNRDPLFPHDPLILLANYFSVVKSQKLGRFEVKNDQKFFVLRPFFNMILIRQQYHDLDHLAHSPLE